MKRIALILLTAVFLTGCGAKKAAEPPVQEASVQETPAAVEEEEPVKEEDPIEEEATTDETTNEEKTEPTIKEDYKYDGYAVTLLTYKVEKGSKSSIVVATDTQVRAAHALTFIAIKALEHNATYLITYEGVVVSPNWVLTPDGEIDMETWLTEGLLSEDLPDLIKSGVKDQMEADIDLYFKSLPAKLLLYP